MPPSNFRVYLLIQSLFPSKIGSSWFNAIICLNIRPDLCRSGAWMQGNSSFIIEAIHRDLSWLWFFPTPRVLQVWSLQGFQITKFCVPLSTLAYTCNMQLFVRHLPITRALSVLICCNSKLFNMATPSARQENVLFHRKIALERIQWHLIYDQDQPLQAFARRQSRV